MSVEQGWRARARSLAIAAAIVVSAVEARAGQSSTLPSPWSAQDIGGPGIPGSTSFDQQVFTVDASGADIWSTADQFQFVYQQISGDVDIVARVDSLTRANDWAKAGVMIRASLKPDSAHGLALVSAARGVAFQRRVSTGALTTHTYGGSFTAPRWLRLVRQGLKVTAYSSADGAAWTRIASDTIALNSVAYVGLAVTSHTNATATTATLSQVSVTPLGLPAAQQDADIGSPLIPGSPAFTAGTYSVTGSGADIWGTADQFNFVYQPVSGDVDVSVRVASFVASAYWAKAGLMIRESLAPSSAHAFALISNARGYAFQRRTQTAGLTDHTSGGTGAAPGWLRLVRTASRFDAYRSSDGQNWTAMGSATIPMVDTVYVGIAVTSHSAQSLATATLDSFALKQGTAPSNVPPVVSLIAPADGSTFTEPASITLTANATDPEGQLDRVEFYAGTTRLASVAAAPYSTTWSNVSAGTYRLTAVAYDATGTSTTSAAATVTVSAANKPPTVALTAPANGATFTAPATINLSATASDADGQVTKVEFYNGTTLVGSVTTGPYACTWSSVPAGTFTLTAVAYDNAGGQTTSASTTVTVNPVLPPPPLAGVVIFQKSVDHDTLVASYRLEVFSAGADPNTDTPVAAADLGKPTPDANGDITSDQSALFTALALGDYIATVSAIGAGGSSRSTALTFTR